MSAPGGGVPDADRKALFLPTPIVWTDKNSLFKYPEKFLLPSMLSPGRDGFAAVHTELRSDVYLSVVRSLLSFP